LIPDLDIAIHGLGFAWGGPPASGRLRSTPEDFLVYEIPLVEPAGEGEHVWLLIRKRQENTEQVARCLARLAGVTQRDVSYAGLKDRNAVTEQWFSVYLPGGSEPEWSALDSASVTLLRCAWHHRKLRRGALRGNAFRIRVRNISGDRPSLDRRLREVAAGGVPNYFGEQRFGRGGFVKLALKTGAPIIPVAVVGAEEALPLLGRVTWFAKSVGIPYVPITPTFPWLGPAGLLPLPSKWRLAFGPPIDLAGEYGAAAADDR